MYVSRYREKLPILLLVEDDQATGEANHADAARSGFVVVAVSLGDWGLQLDGV